MARGRPVLHTCTNEKFFTDNDTHLHRLETTPLFTRGKGREKENVGMQLEQTNVMRW